uniref:Transmembrane protein 65 n=1 Tax=Equus asinus TaxID=9793 RepID=A0A9L0JKS5_EQUAS
QLRPESAAALRARVLCREGTRAGKRVGKPAGEEGGAGGGRRVADSSLWKTRLTDTSPRRTRPPAAFLLSQQAPARTARPLRELSGPGRLTESFRRRSGRGPFGREGDGRGGDGRAGPGSAWCPAPRLPVRRTSGRGRAEPSSCCFPRPRRPLPSRTAAGVPAPQPAMSRLLPLLRSRTARSLRPGPAAAPRPPSWCRRGRGLLALAAPGGPRGLGTHPKKEPMEALNTAQGARDFIYSLHSTERSCLLKELHRFESIAIAQGFHRLGSWARTRHRSSGHTEVVSHMAQ